jgi:hypothetical protein
MNSTTYPSISPSFDAAEMVDIGYWKINKLATSEIICPYGISSCQGGVDSGDLSCVLGILYINLLISL